MEISGKKILVTGADGFIAGYLVQALMEKGWKRIHQSLGYRTPEQVEREWCGA